MSTLTRRKNTNYVTTDDNFTQFSFVGITEAHAIIEFD